MWQLFLFGGIALLVALVVLNEIRSWRRGARRGAYDRSTDDQANVLLMEQQANNHRIIDYGGGGPGT